MGSIELLWPVIIELFGVANIIQFSQSVLYGTCFKNIFPTSQEKYLPKNLSSRIRVWAQVPSYLFSLCVVIQPYISKFCFHCHTQILRPNSCATFMRHNTQEKLKNSHNDFQILFALQCYNVTCIFITYTITHVPLDKKTWQKTCCESLKCMLWEHAREEEVN